MSISIIPDSAPFSDEQRAWLNGFLAGWIGVAEQAGHVPGLGVSADSLSAVSTVDPADALVSDPVGEEDFPWHDAALDIEERLKLSEGRPIQDRLMSAMAQLDCGSCGYLCRTYSLAIASGDETNLTLCSPGGKQTRQALKRLTSEAATESSDSAAAGVCVKTVSHDSVTEASCSRQRPFLARLVESRPLNGPGSEKDTRHVVIDLAGSEITYQVGDALGLYPVNCPELVDRILKRTAGSREQEISGSDGMRRPISTVMAEDCCLRDPSDELLEALMARVQSSDVKRAVAAMLEEGVPEGVDVLDLLEMCPSGVLSAEELVGYLSPLNPRLYSIASSQRVVGQSVHLTVGRVGFSREGRVRKGVASSMLADRLNPGDSVRVFPQANHGGFTVPKDPATAMIMVGPGTGIAPFMGFLQERKATGAPGPHWLFFGAPHQATDFLYQDELRAYQQSGILTHLSTAFSRDGACKIYVQDRMREDSDRLWQWIRAGAHFYVCGDASRMAADVDRALHEVIQTAGGFAAEEATQYVRDMIREKRYLKDVY